MVTPIPPIKPARTALVLALLAALAWPLVAAAGDYDDLVAAEKAFAADSVARGAREAFLAALGDGGVVFEPGPVSGKAMWQARPAAGAKLEWAPEVAEVSSAGDLGYTSGPWRLTQVGADLPRTFGHYLSVWRKDAAGHWKLLVDHGVGHGDVPFPAQVQRRGGISALESPPWRVGVNELRKADLVPAGALEQSLVSSDFLRLRDGRMPDAHSESVAFATANTGRVDSGFAIASDGDMAVTWGGGPGQASWLRVWRRPTTGDTPGLGWRLAVDLSRAVAPPPPSIDN
jgi:ketosteroid isomerase-like protein